MNIEEIQKLMDVEENFLKIHVGKKANGKVEKGLLEFMRKAQLSYFEVDMYVEMLRSRRNTVNSLIATKSCLQSFVDRKGEYDTLIATISAILAAISAIVAVCGFLKEVVDDYIEIECLVYILLFAIITYVFLIFCIMITKRWSIKSVTRAQLLINVINQVSKEKEGNSQSVDEKIAYTSYTLPNKNRKFRIRRKNI